MRFTPGPWRLIKEDGYYSRAVEAPNGWRCDKLKKRVCSVRPHRRTDEAAAEAEANAALIAAAPDLLKELRKLAIIERHRMASGGGTVHVGYNCKVCDQDWAKTQPETHRSHCILRADAFEVA